MTSRISFIARLAALVPRPRAHLLMYHGVLAPAAKSAGTPLALASELRRPTRTSWAELMKRAFEIDVLICPHCGGPRKLIAFLTDGLVVRKVRRHLGLPPEPPALAPARAPPEPELAW